MRITVDLDAADLKYLEKCTGEKIKSRAVGRAVSDFLRRQKLREFGRLMREGSFSGAFSDDYAPDPALPLAAEASFTAKLS